jgi:PKD repeat protein
MRRKIISIIISMLFLSATLTAFAFSIKNNEQNENDSMPVIEANLLGNWMYVRSYNNYAPKGMPDFDQEQDAWQKIVNYANPNNILDTQTALNDDLLLSQCFPPCIAPGPDAYLDTIPVGTDKAEYYYCGPLAAAIVLWWIDSKFEKNTYPDSNQDTCNLITKYPGENDDHDPSNVKHLVEDLAANWIGTSMQCTTTLNMLKNGMQNFINNQTQFNYIVNFFYPNNFNLNDLWYWVSQGYGVILQLDCIEGGHYVALNGVDKTNEIISISDPDLDITNSTTDHALHNDAGVVSHDTYSLQPGTFHLPDYIGLGANITAALIVGPKYMLIPSLPITPIDIGVLPGQNTAHESIYCMADTPGIVNDIEIKYLCPEGIEYAGGATIDGVPIEPIINGNELIWFINELIPGQQINIGFDIITVNPVSTNLKRAVRCWGLFTDEQTEIYGDSYAQLNVFDDTYPEINNISHYLDDVNETVTISCNVTDNWIIDSVFLYIQGPEGFTAQIDMQNTIDDLFEATIDISNWDYGNYLYNVLASDIAGNSLISPINSFYITDELIADANGPYFATADEIVQFFGYAYGGLAPYAYYWDFGDGNTSIDQNPEHVYENAMNYTVSLTVVDTEGSNEVDTTWAVITEKLYPDLLCEGSITWTDIEPGETVTGSFTVGNFGDEGSILDWSVCDFPDWGNWIFTPSSGLDLTVLASPLTVDVTVIAPDEGETTFSGDITICNDEDNTDTCTIPVSLTTPRNKEILFTHPIFQFLKYYVSMFPILQFILKIIQI